MTENKTETKDKKDYNPPTASSHPAKAGRPSIKKTKKKIVPDFNINTDEMMGAGLHFGHRISRLHPKMKPYILGIKNTIHIIDLEKTAKKFTQALKFIEKLISEEKTLLLVGTKIQFKNLTKEIAEDCEIPYINERWLGGTFTNFGTILKRIEYYRDLEEKKKAGELEKYTKKERLEIDKELQRLKIKFGGIKNMKKLPDTVFVLDARKDALSAKESRKKGIQIIGIIDTNVDPTSVDYPIPASDDSISSVKYILEKVKEVILKSKKKAKKD